MNRYAEEESQSSLDRFRGNLILRGGAAFAEDSWKGRLIKVGGQVLRVVAPCQRCQMVCVDQSTAERTKEPLLALSNYDDLFGNLFRSLRTLFALLNGDSILLVYQTMCSSASSEYCFFSQLYLYSFLVIFITTVLAHYPNLSP